jgi:HEAT repeat protein
VETLGPDITIALLLELGRALRAWHFYASDRPRLDAALARVARNWSSALGATSVFAVDLRDGAFFTPAGQPLSAPGLAEIAQPLGAHGIRHLRADPGIRAEEVTLLVRALASEHRDSVPVEDLERWLHEHGARRIWLSEPRESDPDPSAHYLAGLCADLVRALEALDTADSVSDYNLAANRAESAVDRMLREGAAADAYRAVLALGRHVADPHARSAALHREACERLRRLLHCDALLEYTLCQACETSGLSSVRATQVLLLAGDLAVPRLVDRYAQGGRGDPQQTAMILLALGERALDTLIAQLSSADAGRARRCARLIGDLQHPRGVPPLAAALRASDAALCADAARALARIGSTAATHALVDALGAGEPVARAAIGALAGSRHPLAVRALCDIAAGRREFPEPFPIDAIRALGHPGNAGAVATLTSILEHRSLLARSRERPRRMAAALALGRIGGPAARRALELHARRGEGDVSDACQRALRELGQAPGASR